MLNKFRHKWELPMVFLAILLAVVATIVAIALLANQLKVPDWLMTIVLAAYVSPFAIALFLHYNYWKEVVNSVEVNEGQYPELYEIFREQAEKCELGFIPKLYVKNGNGTMNAFAAKAGVSKTSGYIVVYSDIVDTFYELGDAETIRFILSHELGHIKLGHVTVRRNLLKGVLKPLFLSDTLVRAQEYSADRFGAAINQQGIATKSLSVLIAGKRNYQSFDVAKYIEKDAKEISWFWVAIVNFMANHAVGRRRLAAAHDMDTKGWENVHGKML